MQNTTSSSSSSKNSGEGLVEYMKKNPLLFAVVVFPTVTMGLLLMVKPKLRPKFMGGDGNGNTERGSFLRGGSSSIGGSYNIPNEAPVYENANEDIIEEGKTKEIRTSAVVLATKTIDDASIVVAQSSFSRQGNNVDCDDADGSELARTRVGMEEESKSSSPNMNIIDLISAIGIRPHPDDGGSSI